MNAWIQWKCYCRQVDDFVASEYCRWVDDFVDKLIRKQVNFVDKLICKQVDFVDRNL